MKLLSRVKAATLRKSKSGNQSDASLQSPTSTSAHDTGCDAICCGEVPVDSTSPHGLSQDRQQSLNDANEEGLVPAPASEPVLRSLNLGSFHFPASYTYPSLYSEASSMLSLSLLIYTLTELRELARRGVLNDPAKSLRILQMPLPLETACSIIESEAEMLKEVLSDGKHDATLSALSSLMEDQKRRKEKEHKAKEVKVSNSTEPQAAKEEQGMFSGWMDSWNGCLGGGFSFDEIFCGGDLGNIDNGHGNDPNNNAQSSMLYTVEDAKCNEELVYAVGVNPIEERITVMFRGSVTKVDFMTDANINMLQVPEPSLPMDSTNKSIIGIHQGFYEYLFGSKDGTPSKYEEIMTFVQQLFYQDTNRLKHYQLYVTGHSLGGALATLFGYYYASSSTMHRLPLPVTVVSVASPRVGNLPFARSFTELESQGKIRHLRIANHRDPVTLGPSVSSKRALTLSVKSFSPLGYLALKASGNLDRGKHEEEYYHTGMKMKLRKEVSASGQQCEISYSGASLLSKSSPPQSQPEDKEDLSTMLEELKTSAMGVFSQDLPMVSYHYGEAYAERILLAEPHLGGLALNQLYLEKS